MQLFTTMFPSMTLQVSTRVTTMTCSCITGKQDFLGLTIFKFPAVYKSCSHEMISKESVMVMIQRLSKMGYTSLLLSHNESCDC